MKAVWDPAELHQTLDELPCGFLQTDVEGTFLRVNRTFCSWVGYAREELVGVRRFQDLFTMGARIFHQTHWLPLLHIQGSVAEVKLEIVPREGRPIPMVINAIRRTRGGVLVDEIAAYVAHDRDKYERELLASRRKVEATLKDADAAHAKARDRALIAEQMMGVVSHDLRNPLSTIQMSAVMLMKRGCTPEQQTTLDRILRATSRSSRLISDLLDFTQARLGTGLKVSPRAFPLHTAVREAVEDLAVAFPGRQIRHRGGDAGEVVADPDRVVQMVGNLVANAVTYGDEQRPVEVATAIGPDAFTVSVQNWGRPIEPALLPRIFEPLSRGAAAGDVRSLGLGLYIVDQIAKAHGGTMRVESDESRGTLFEARVPRR